MISPFEVYVVMQLDSISNGLAALTFITGSLGVVIGAYGALELSSSKSCPELDISKREAATAAFLLPKARKLLVAATFLCLLLSFIPSSKTAAAMILVPALTSKEVIEPVGAEAKELYNLLKRGLTEYVDNGQAPATVEKTAN